MEKKEKIVIRGNEFYEIDLDCMKRRQEGKECAKSQEEKKQSDRNGSGKRGRR